MSEMTREAAENVLAAFGREIAGTGIQVCCGYGVPCSDDAGQQCCGQLLDYSHYTIALAALRQQAGQQARPPVDYDAMAVEVLRRYHGYVPCDGELKDMSAALRMGPK